MSRGKTNYQVTWITKTIALPKNKVKAWIVALFTFQLPVKDLFEKLFF